MLSLLFPFASTFYNIALGYAYICLVASFTATSNTTQLTQVALQAAFGYRKLTAPGFNPKGKHCVITGMCSASTSGAMLISEPSSTRRLNWPRTARCPTLLQGRGWW